VKRVGLTGGIGTGKSAAAAVFSAAGVPVIGADQVAREIVAPGPVLDAIVADFGARVLRSDGELDRAAMRDLITADPAARARLEATTHPAIGARIATTLHELAASGAALAIVEAALMVETGSWRRYDAVVVVTCSPALQLQRVLARDGGTEAAARALIAAQLPLADKEAVATHLIRNDSTLSALHARTLEVLAALRAPSNLRAR